MKKLIPLSIKIRISNFLKYYKGYSKNKNRYISESQKIFIVGSPEHDNLGDHAITYAQQKFLNDSFPDSNVLEIVADDFMQNLRCLRKYTNDEDVFVLQGGGNFGIEYFREEEIRRKIISLFPNNKIVLFPQTIFFGGSERGYIELEKTKNIYMNHKDLTLIAREKTSYQIMKDNFESSNILLTPDIVMFLNMSEPLKRRSGALLCIRTDKESIFNDKDKQLIELMCSENYKDITYNDTCVHHGVKIKDREEELYKIWNEFKQVELVITDRLHGMIFAAITSTPCIALGNYNYKVKGSYEWIQHLEYIKFCENIADIPTLIEEIKLIKTHSYNNDFSLEYYNKIIETMEK
ncbi:polysaccharide pyruvyl transferase [Acinetobacter sp. CUI P1]|nr:polysaccharide pyruvyl transferase [Acinetobacter sp. CUI P1]